MKSAVAILLFILSGAVSNFSLAQDSSAVNDELKFISYLSNRGENSDALIVINRLLNKRISFEQSTLDSIQYFRGWSFYQLQKADSAIISFDAVSLNSPLSDKSRYYGIFNRIYAKQWDAAVERITSDTVQELKSIRDLDLAGISLLRKDFAKFDSLSKNFSFDNYATDQEEKSMLKYADTLRHYPKRSGFLAGLFSAIVPGTGKVYAGKKSQGIAAFLEIAALGGAAGEYYYRSGPKSAGFIVFGSLFSLFYIGNIWGSALSISVNRNDFYQRIDNNIMVDLHVPLRRIFN